MTINRLAVRPAAASLTKELLEQLDDGLLIAWRISNSRLDWSIMNRPPSIQDHALATALVFAMPNYKLVIDKKIMRPEKILRSDGREVTYNEYIDVDFTDGRIRSSRKRDMTQKVLAAIVHQLMQSTAPMPGVRG